VIASRLAHDGVDVVLAGRQPDLLEEQAGQILSAGGRARTAVIDLTDLDAIPALAEAIGTVEILINNAASPEDWCPILERNDERWDVAFKTNLLAPLALIREFGSRMAHHGGSIINISSIAGTDPAPFLGTYSVTKAALNMLTRIAAMELGSSGVRVNAVAPGVTDVGKTYELLPDGLLENLGAITPSGRLGTADEVADVVLWLAGPGSSFVNGQIITVDGAMTAGLWSTSQTMGRYLADEFAERTGG
jgi:NAD(P)-dependent dehydrogenase (short-subunit alcohol dehydrogenase family)